MELSKSNERWGGGLPLAAISTAARVYIVTLVSMLLPLGNTGQFTLAVRDRRVYIYISESTLKRGELRSRRDERSLHPWGKDPL